jgi:hypothetical protein
VGFAGKERGYLDTKLADRTVGAGHAKPLVFRHKRTVYSLCSKPFFEAIGETDNRNRRTHEVFTIRNRLIGLDFVQKYKDRHFLATESEKVAFFRDVLRIEPDHLPAKRYRAKNSRTSTDRFFVDKFPIALSGDESAGNPVVEFCYVDEGRHSTSGFEMYLKRYLRLLVRMPVFRLVYIATSRDHFVPASKLFERAVVNGGRRVPVDPAITRLLGYFRDRELYERRELDSFDQPKLIQFRDDRKTFSDQKYESLFARWREGGDAVVMRILCPEAIPDSAPKCEFLTFLSAFRYELFGTLMNGNWRAA